MNVDEAEAQWKAGLKEGRKRERQNIAASLDDHLLSYVRGELNEYDPTHPDHNETLKDVLEAVEERIEDMIEGFGAKGTEE